VSYIYRRSAALAVVGAILSFIVLALLASRIAGHLSRNMSRPLQELVGWTERIGRGLPLPEGPPRRGAPEFEVLRQRMRDMSRELELGRTRAIEAERAAVLRETARQVAHELKNPLTPIRFAVERLRRELPSLSPGLAETVVILNAVDACRSVQNGRPAEITVRVRPLSGVADVEDNGAHANGNGTGATAGVEIAVADSGCGISKEQLGRIWEPYVTSKPGGTGLGLAIARQTVLAHRGAVAAESVPGSGTTIRFVLPVNSNGTSDA
jgi:signal transduction histidine kinase